MNWILSLLKARYVPQHTPYCPLFYLLLHGKKSETKPNLIINFSVQIQIMATNIFSHLLSKLIAVQIHDNLYYVCTLCNLVIIFLYE
jgi:hypothetical protein